MSIVTRTGDQGTTALMYNRRVSKCDGRIEACGAVDELNAAIGLARATAADRSQDERLMALQKDLVPLMGELATIEEDREKYERDGLPVLGAAMTAKLDTWVKEIESRQVSFHGWATPGANLHSAALEVARTVCRRAERRVCNLQKNGQLHNPEILVFLNRLSDLLWLLARQAETG